MDGAINLNDFGHTDSVLTRSNEDNNTRSQLTVIYNKWDSKDSPRSRFEQGELPIVVFVRQRLDLI